ncbi:MAG: recombinase family protein [Alicyclobacillus macrosporangiidus]|uniref:recombinase family protein n=1 Tax=Alicyclobacillus macrosporangiidus TaxID=392015 RepID=UPI0026E9733E|nr:recombinase family protein [Alicyclobacillus macrosporangiidus]MCL6599702.1 recombinase family protein [Alicyclobacillus macrosporangiidus]
MKVCAVYARVSTEMQAESLQNQVDYAKEYIRRLGEQYVVDDACVYTDLDQSGYYTRFVQRPAIQRALEDARAGRFEVIVFKEISRISRDQAEHIEIVSRFQMHGVRVIAINDNLDSDRPETLDLLGIHSVMSEMESKRISSRVSSGKKSMARRGHWVGEAPIGYRLNPDTRRLEIDPVHAATVIDIFRLFTEEGYGALRIAQWLNERGRWTKNGRPWSRVTVRRVLQNPAYTGDTVYGRTRNALRRIFDDRGYTKIRSKHRVPEADWVVVRGTHPALIERAVFHRAQARFRGDGRDGPRNRGRHPLTGILRCGRCGSGMVCQAQRRNGNEYRYYACGRAFRFGRSACSQPNLNAAEAEAAVWRLLGSLLSPYRDLPIQARVKHQGGDLQARARRLQAERRRIEQALERLYLDDAVSATVAESLKRRWMAQVARLDEELAELATLAARGAEAYDGEAGHGQARDHPPWPRRVRDVLPFWDPPGAVPREELRRIFHGLVAGVTVDGVRVTDMALRYQLRPGE